MATDCEVFIHTMGKLGEFVPNLYEMRTNFVRILYEFCRNLTQFTLCIGTVGYCVKPTPIQQGFLHTQWGSVTGHAPRSHSFW